MRKLRISPTSRLPGKSTKIIVLGALLLWAGLAQAFLLESLDKQRVDLLDYVGDGRWTIIMFWSTDCVACEEQKPAFEAFHRKHENTVAKVMGIALDGMENEAGIKKLIDLHEPSYTNLVVYTDVFYRQYEELVGKPFRITPTYLVFDPEGNVAGNIYGSMDFEALAVHVNAQN